MLYRKPDGTFAIDDSLTPSIFVDERRAAREARIRNAERYERMRQQVEAIELGEDELLNSFASAAEIAMHEGDEVGAELAYELAKFFGAVDG